MRQKYFRGKISLNKTNSNIKVGIFFFIIWRVAIFRVVIFLLCWRISIVDCDVIKHLSSFFCRNFYILLWLVIMEARVQWPLQNSLLFEILFNVFTFISLALSFITVLSLVVVSAYFYLRKKKFSRLRNEGIFLYCTFYLVNKVFQNMYTFSLLYLTHQKSVIFFNIWF